MPTMQFSLLFYLLVAGITFGHAVVLSPNSLKTSRDAISTAYRPRDSLGKSESITTAERVARGSVVTVADAARSMAFVLSRTNSLCSASVIADSWLLLAGHCDFAVSSEVVVGRHGASLGTNHRVIGVYKHRKFSKTHYAYTADIALAKISPPVRAGSALRLNKNEAIPRDLDTVYGFGYGWNEHGKNAKVLRTARFQALSPRRCRATVTAARMPKTSREIHPVDHLCANEGTVGMGMCNGDSGGPLIEKTGAGFVQVGVSSYRISKTCGETNIPDIYTRISTYYWYVRVTIGTAPGFIP